MADAGQIIGTITSGGASALKWILIIIGVIIFITLFLGGIIYWRFKRAKYNLDVEIKMPRSDGKLVMAEWGKGCFDSKKGVVLIKRRKMKAVPMKVIDIRKYLQGQSLLTVIQVAAEDYRPVLNDSWTEHIQRYKDDNGEIVEVKESILNIKVDTGEYKAWKSAWDAAAKRAYSLTTFLQQFAVPISIAIVLLACFVGFAIIWTRLPSVCG